MAKQFSIKGVIEFLGVDKAVAEVKKLDSTVAAMKKNTQQIGKGSQQLGQGLQGIAVGGAAVGAGFGLAIKQASDFEQAMANINSVNELTQAQFKLLERTALQMGATTVFSATEAAEGMFELTKAGLTAEQSVQAIPGVLAAAATEGLGLAQASEIVVSVLQGQNLQMDQATKVADVLAQTANSTAAGITDLGEAFKYANQLSAAGLVGFEDTAAALGILSNAGLKGSIAGTSLVAMFNQITKPSKDVQKAFGGINNMMDLFTDKTTGKMKDLPQLIEIIGQAADQQSNDFQKMAFLTDFVGVEGAKAFSALRRAVTAKDAQGRPMFQGLREDIENSAGAADKMAKKRLNTLQGSLKLISSALETVSIGLGQQFIPMLTEGAKEIQKLAEQAGSIFMVLMKGQEELTKGDLELLNTPMGRFIQGFIAGVKEAMQVAKDSFNAIRGVLATFGIGVQGAEQDTGRLIGKFALLFAMATPLIGGFLLIGAAVGSLINTFMGLGNVLIGAGKLWWNMSTIAVKGIMMIGKGAIWLLTNPIGWWILGIAAVVAAGWFLYNNWGNIWGATKKLFSDGIDWIVGSFQYLINWFKSASIGEIIVKTLLLPIRLALTPLMEMLQTIANSNWAQKLIGKDTANMIKKVASTISILPDAEDISKMRVGQQQPVAGDNTQPVRLAEAPMSRMPVTDSIAAQSVEAQRMSVPPSAAAPANVNVSQPPINLTIENITKLDGKELNRSMTKQQIENSERAGMNATNPKNRQMLQNNGGLAAGFGR